MKICDMWGARLKVLALGFPGLHDRFSSGLDGWTFASAGELAQHLTELSCRDTEGLMQGRHEVSWERGWAEEAWPHLKRAGSGTEL